MEVVFKYESGKVSYGHPVKNYFLLAWFKKKLKYTKETSEEHPETWEEAQEGMESQKLEKQEILRGKKGNLCVKWASKLRLVKK